MSSVRTLSMFASASEKHGDSNTAEGSQESIEMDSDVSIGEFDRLFEDVCQTDSEEEGVEETNKKSTVYLRKVDEHKISSVRRKLAF